MKPHLKKGFTLIELMIVVAIIGVLAVTIVPALTGAQARARDAGRIAGLQNISAVLETFFSDEGQYPTSKPATAGTATDTDTGHQNCFSSENGSTAKTLEKMLKGGKAPLNPQRTSKTATCGQQGSYAFYNLSKGGVDSSGYVVLADVESAQKANALIYTGATTPLSSGAADATFEKVIGSDYFTWGKVPTDPATTDTGWGDSNITGGKISIFAIAN